nr:putative ribonuclease H-like domain-containing protein [Tanacetum cinerariifolium]
MKQAVEQHRVESKTFEVKMNKVLIENERLLEQVIRKDIVNILVNSSVNNANETVHECEKCLKLKTELQNDFIKKEIYDNLFKSCTTLEKHCISLEVDTQINQELFQRDNSFSQQEMLKVDVAPLAPKLRNNRIVHSDYIRHTQEETVTFKEIVEQGRSINPLNTSLDYARINLSTCASGSQPSGNTKKDKIQQTPSSTKKNKIKAHPRTVRSSLINKNCVVKSKDTASVLHSNLNVNSDLQCVTITTPADVPLRKPIAIESNTPKPVVTLVYLQKPKASRNNVPGLLRGWTWHNLFSVGKFYDSDLEVAFRQHTCFIRNLDGVDMLSGSRGNNLYTLSLRDIMKSSPICLLSKATKTKSWLWHRRLSHLNFDAINHLARKGLVRGLPKLNFEKDHLCSVCAMGKSKKKFHKPKSEDTNQEKLYLLHMDLCRPMRVESVNGKKYILVIVNDYSRFTWVGCLRLKDETLDFIMKFLKIIQVQLKVPVRRIQTDNGTEFVNQTLHEYYEQVGISYETSVAHFPQQNGVVERRNRTLIEAARTMLIYAWYRISTKGQNQNRARE